MRLSSFLIVTLGVVLAASAAPGDAGAQVRRLTDVPDSVPRALVEAVIDPIGSMRMIGGGARPRLIVGTLPSGLAQRIWIPPGSTILGGIESSAFGLAIIHSPMSEDSLNAGFAREQPRMGWTLPHEHAPVGGTMGFIAAATTVSVGGSLVPAGLFCSGGTTLSISVTPLDPLTREIRATAMDGLDRRCQPAPAAPRVIPFPRPQYPTLVNPQGSGNGFANTCSNWNSAGGGGTTRLQTRMNADDVLLHYGNQLADSGWAPGENQTVARSWTRRDSTGALIELTLTARLHPSSPGCIEVQMEVRSRRPS